MNKCKCRILIVDDDSIYQYAAKKTIEVSGLSADISFCMNGEEALAFITQNIKNPSRLPHIILLDVNMPIMNGWEFLEAYDVIKNEISKKIIIYVISSSMDENDIRHSGEFKTVEGYIVKPVLKDEFIRILAGLCL